VNEKKNIIEVAEGLIEGAGDAFNYDLLDPGIRETVRRLRAWGFVTTDSGDGVTKLAQGWSPDEVLDVPHVFMQVANGNTIENEATGLLELLRGAGVPMESQTAAIIAREDGGPLYGWIDAMFDPVEGTALIGLLGVDDSMWPEATP